MEQRDERDDAGDAGRIDRRKALGIGAAVGAGVWAAPAILSVGAAANATPVPPGTCVAQLLETWSAGTVPAGGVLNVTNANLPSLAPGWVLTRGNVDFVRNNGSYFPIIATFPSGRVLVDTAGSNPATIERTLVCALPNSFAQQNRTLQVDYAGSQRNFAPNAGARSMRVSVLDAAGPTVLGSTTVTNVPRTQGKTTLNVGITIPANCHGLIVRIEDITTPSSPVGLLLGDVRLGM